MISETGFSLRLRCKLLSWPQSIELLRLQVEPSQLDPISTASSYLRTGDGDRIHSPKGCVLNENRRMDNVQKQKTNF
jgi:hypothetical protein